MSLGATMYSLRENISFPPVPLDATLHSFYFRGGKSSYFSFQEVKIKMNAEKRPMISKELLEILACPKCKGDVKLTDKKDGLICDRCKLLYEIRDDIPVMLIDEAKEIKS